MLWCIGQSADYSSSFLFISLSLLPNISSVASIHFWSIVLNIFHHHFCSIYRGHCVFDTKDLSIMLKFIIRDHIESGKFLPILTQPSYPYFTHISVEFCIEWNVQLSCITLHNTCSFGVSMEYHHSQWMTVREVRETHLDRADQSSGLAGKRTLACMAAAQSLCHFPYFAPLFVSQTSSGLGQQVMWIYASRVGANNFMSVSFSLVAMVVLLPSFTLLYSHLHSPLFPFFSDLEWSFSLVCLSLAAHTPSLFSTSNPFQFQLFQ